MKLSQKLTWKTQGSLLRIENELAKDYIMSVIPSYQSDTRRFLALTSLPFTIAKRPKVKLEDLWLPMDCQKCKKVVHRHTMPTGNMYPKYMIIGEAPGVGDGELIDHFDRALVYGQSSHMVRKSLLKLGIYHECWFTNLLKCSTPENRKPSDSECQGCSPFLLREILLLKPEKIIVLGNNAYELYDRFAFYEKTGVEACKAYHPRYFIRKGRSSEDYAKHLKEVIEQ